MKGKKGRRMGRKGEERERKEKEREKKGKRERKGKKVEGRERRKERKEKRKERKRKGERKGESKGRIVKGERKGKEREGKEIERENEREKKRKKGLKKGKREKRKGEEEKRRKKGRKKGSERKEKEREKKGRKKGIERKEEKERRKGKKGEEREKRKGRKKGKKVKEEKERRKKERKGKKGKRRRKKGKKEREKERERREKEGKGRKRRKRREEKGKEEREGEDKEKKGRKKGEKEAEKEKERREEKQGEKKEKKKNERDEEREEREKERRKEREKKEEGKKGERKGGESEKETEKGRRRKKEKKEREKKGEREKGEKKRERREREKGCQKERERKEKRERKREKRKGKKGERREREKREKDRREKTNTNNGAKKPFREVINAVTEDRQAMGQPPITFTRQVLALVSYPELIKYSNFPDDVKERAKFLLAGCNGGSAVLQLLDCETCGLKTGVMVPIPHYPLFPAVIAEFNNMQQMNYYLDESNGWAISIKELKRALNDTKGTCKPRALVVINPGNPTGQVLTKQTIREIINFAYEEGLILIADEVHQQNVFDRNSEFHSFKKVLMEMGLPYSKMELASFMSSSKGYMGECGMRGAYAEVINLQPDVQAMFLKSITASLCPTVLGQIALDCVVKPPVPGGPSHELFVRERDSILKTRIENAEIAVNTFNSIEGMSCNVIQGAMYAFPQIRLLSKAIETAKQKQMHPDEYYASQLLENTGISIVPGSGFGQKDGTYHFRQVESINGKKYIVKYLDNNNDVLNILYFIYVVEINSSISCCKN
ncbi:Alanine aminotransferase 2 [Gryllus bimaculatus]|nr:Alanine aminotransferase 2 [Gryllus bimaculatus]